MEIRSIGIIGAGTMGNGIAQVAAGAGFEVILLDINDAALEKGLAALSKSLDRLIKKESITSEQKRRPWHALRPPHSIPILPRSHW